MPSSETFTQIASTLPGVTSAPHFDRLAFKVNRIFATLAADGLTANLKFTPEEQEFKCLISPDVYFAIDNGWGRQGWTTLDLTVASEEEIAAALAMAHVHAVANASKKRR